jgi:hypothetical protein
MLLSAVAICVVSCWYFLCFCLLLRAVRAREPVSVYVSFVAFAICLFLIASHLAHSPRSRTASQFEDSMIIKIFVFQFVNRY